MPKPGVFNFVNKATWDARNALGSLPKVRLFIVIN